MTRATGASAEGGPLRDLRSETGGRLPPPAGRVLVVDDEESMRDSCLQVLGREGYDVVVAADGTQGLELLRRSRPHAALVDLKMPGMSGQEFLRRLREESAETVPIVITGYATLESAVQAIKDGAYDFLPKPFTPDELRLVVRRSMDRHRLVSRVAALEHDRDLMREKFAAMIGHQMRSPLAAVAENLEVLHKGLAGPLTEKQAETLERMAVRIAALLELIDDWTLLSGAEQVRLAEGGKPVDLAAVVAEAVGREAEARPSPRAQVAVSIARDPGPVLGDARLLRELVANLVSNALKYTPPDGRVNVGLDTDGSMALVTVSDTGIGIPEEELPFVFDDFFRGRRAKERPGTGLGLSIARRIADLHGGSIAVASQVGAGSTFKVRLPRLESSDGHSRH